MDMNLYVVAWSCICLGAAAIVFKDRRALLPEWRQYLRFLMVPWKLMIFIPAFLFITFAGHFTDDETWDIVTGSVMSILAYSTAPWVVGIIFKVFTRKRHPIYLFVAIAISLFSSSWFYDGYLYWRDGHYTARWLGNLILAPIVYFAGGLLWNLETKNKYFSSFSFFRDDWPAPPIDTSIKPLIPVMVTLMLIAGSLLVSYVHWHF